MARSPQTAAKNPGSTPQIGTTGLRAYGGFIEEEFLRELRGNQANRVYREMGDNDPVCSAILFVMQALLRQVEWTVQAAGEDQAAQDAAELVRAALFDDMETTWDDLISEACTMFQFGHAVMETVWKYRRGPDAAPDKGRSEYSDGLLAPRIIALRGQETLWRWDITEQGEIKGVYQHPWVGQEVYIPAERFMLFRTVAVKNNPLGRSVLRGAYRPWFFKKRIEEIEAIGVERDLAGYPVMRIPGRLMDASASAEEKSLFDSYKAFVTRMRRNQSEGIVMPSDRDDSGNYQYTLELLASAGTRAMDTTKIIDRYDRRIAMTVLADFIFLGQQSTGSFALSSDKTAMFATALGAWLHGIADVLNRDLVGRMWAFNKLDPMLRPTLVPGDIESPDLDKLASYVTALAGAGAAMFPDRELENVLRKKAGLPLAPEEADDEPDLDGVGEGDDADDEAPGAEGDE